MKRKLPVRGFQYSLRQIYEQLDLDDSPSLHIRIGDLKGPIQDSHVTVEQMLSVPGLADTQWTYRRTTWEYIPCFEYSGTAEAILACVDSEPWKPRFAGDEVDNYTWITPKGFPRAQ